MNKRLITLVVLGASAAFGWFLSANYVERQALEQETVSETVPVVVYEAPTTTEPLPTSPAPEPVAESSATPNEPSRPVERESGGCYIGGCSSQLCSESTGMASTCEWRESYACYATATCTRQPDGACGWTETAELKQCLTTSATSNELEAEIIMSM